MDYLLECNRTAREELIERVKHRDSYLNLHLLVQAVLLAMSLDVEIAGVHAKGPLPFSLYLSVPLTFVFALLYYTEDRLIGQLSSYIGSLADHAAKETQVKFVCWDVLPQLREYARTTVMYRFIAHLAAFVVAPSVLLGMLYSANPPDSTAKWAWTCAQILLLLLLVGLSVREYFYRRKTGQSWKNQAEDAAVNGNSAIARRDSKSTNDSSSST